MNRSLIAARRPLLFSCVAIFLTLSVGLIRAEPGKIALTVQAAAPGKPISPDLFGIFFEDLNYAADGGLYGELIQNRSFEYQATEQPTWNPLSMWEVVARGGGRGKLAVDAGDPIHPNNPHYAVLDVAQLGEGVGLANSGFDGIPLQEGARYSVSLFAKHLYNGARWSPGANQGTASPLIVRFENAAGENLGEATLPAPTRAWQRFSATLVARKTEPAARFLVLMTAPGGVALDVVSVFPEATFHSRPNGLRPDLAQVIADLHPKFVRFPGGCLAHGNGLSNIYRWKDTIGPIEQRREQSNLWGYHQSVGLGYFEYFQFCEDIGAKPVPVVAAGVCCQNSGDTNGMGQKGLPLAAMPEYIQDILDLVEYANGPATSTWGAKRAAAGHPEPFHLQYLGLGNEDEITPTFQERFKLIYDAMRAHHPEITVIGTVGPAPRGTDFDAGWKFAGELAVPVVDEHYYMPPQWFLENLARYDTYDRTRSQVYVGEYAAHDDRRRSTLRSALAEAYYMTGLERNGDIVRLASYAPLLAKMGHTQWNPDLIYFNNAAVYPTVNYYVQQFFGTNGIDTLLPWTPHAGSLPAGVAFSAGRDRPTGDVILKIVNSGDDPQSLHVNLASRSASPVHATRTILTGDPLTINEAGHPPTLVPHSDQLSLGSEFDENVPAHAVVVIRVNQHGT